MSNPVIKAILDVDPDNEDVFDELCADLTGNLMLQRAEDADDIMTGRYCFVAGPEVDYGTGPALSDSLFCNAWLTTRLKPLADTYDLTLELDAAENVHYINSRQGPRYFEKEIWPAIVDALTLPRYDDV